MPESTAPPPPKSGSGGFIAIAVIMLLAGGALVFWKVSGSKEDPQPTPPPVASKPAKPKIEAVIPAPPPIEEPDAGEKKTQNTKRVVGGGGGGCGPKCEGTAGPQLQSALRGKAGQARGCYERALRQNATLSGRLTVAVRIGAQGQVCSASVSQNSLGDPGVASCVANMFRSGKFPAPSGGCVDTAVPMNFVPKS